MNKRELVDAIADRVGDKKTATEAVNAISRPSSTRSRTGTRSRSRASARSRWLHKPARQARNPSTGEPIKVAESWGPKFRAGSDFKELVNVAGKKASKKK